MLSEHGARATRSAGRGNGSGHEQFLYSGTSARRAFLEATLFGFMVVVLALPTSLLHRFIGFQGFIELLAPVGARFSLGYK